MPQKLPCSIARFRPLVLLGLVPLLAGCNLVVLDPAGDVARQQGNLILISTALMLLIIVPVMILTVVFAWRYRAANKEATYKPDWDHSTQLELVIWSAPLLIIICLGALTWVATHLLDPYRPLARTAPGQAVAAGIEPVEVQVVALDWKWLFIYPGEGVATVNELVLPVDRPVRFDITSSNMMNTFYVPTLAGMIYAMPGMRSQLHAVLDREVESHGYSANYSGAGFTHMRFRFEGVDDAGFDDWVQRVRSSGNAFDLPAYRELLKPSERVPVMHFGSIDPDLFRRTVERCIEPGTQCMSEWMQHHDHRAGGAAPGDASP